MQSHPVCSICLADFQDKSYLQPCLHSYCYTCILFWFKQISNSSPIWSCPSCRQRVDALVHDIHPTENDEFHLVKLSNSPNEHFIDRLIADDVGAKRKLASARSIVQSTPAFNGTEEEIDQVRHMVSSSLENRRCVYAGKLKPIISWPLDPGDPLRPLQRPLKGKHASLMAFMERDLTLLLQEAYEPWVQSYIVSVIENNLECKPSNKESVVKEIQDLFPKPQQADIFIDSLVYFASSRLDMTAWDRDVLYEN